MKRRILILVCVAVLVAPACWLVFRSSKAVVLTGVVTTDQVIVSPQIQGRLEHLYVAEGDVVTNGQLLATIQPEEWSADMAFYTRSQEQIASQVSAAEADVKFQESQSSNQISQAEAMFASAESQVRQAEADLEIAALNFKRIEGLYKQGVESVQSFDQTRTAQDAARARVESQRKQAQAAQAAVEVARSSLQQVVSRRASLEAMTRQFAAASAQKDRAQVRLNYTELRAPVDGFVDVRAALQGEVVNPAQPVVTLINPDNLWVRVDVEEGVIDRIRLGDKLPVRLPSEAEREGTVFYRRADADFATQRDVSRTKRDIRTFEVRLRCDNRDRALALGMSAYVTLRLPSR
jgi:HlyD family secretion protein